MSGGLAKAIQEVDGKIVSVRTGTVVTNNAALSDTMVSLDKDLTKTPVAALALTNPLPAGTRVTLLSYPTSGLVILGTMQEIPVTLGTGAVQHVFTSSGSLAAATVAGARALRVRCWGAGGGGGGCGAAAAGQSSAGGGAGGGGYAESILAIGTVTFPVTITVGTGGASNSGANGGNGGATSFDTQVAANGGTGGVAAGSGAGIVTIVQGSDGGSGTVGQILADGGGGGLAFRYAITQVVTGLGGDGAMGGGETRPGFNSAGRTGQFPGGGGSGSWATAGAGPFGGGVGANGLCVVDAFYDDAKLGV